MLPHFTCEFMVKSDKALIHWKHQDIFPGITTISNGMAPTCNVFMSN